jgi:hypothetical protein
MVLALGRAVGFAGTHGDQTAVGGKRCIVSVDGVE